MSQWLKVHDNGVHAFVPPSFSWDLINVETGETIDTVSEFDTSRLDLDANQTTKLMEEVTSGARIVDGMVTETDVHQPSGERGKALVITRVAPD